jgi:hypothetical protein
VVILYGLCSAPIPIPNATGSCSSSDVGAIIRVFVEFLALGLPFILLGEGFLKMKSWAYWFQIIVTTITFLVLLAALFIPIIQFVAIPAFGLSFVSLIYLYSVRRYFE